MKLFTRLFGKKPVVEMDTDVLDPKDPTLHVLFEYGDLKATMPHHHKLRANRFIFHALTIQRFELWTRRQGEDSFPIATITGLGARTKVLGELYAMHPKQIKELDNRRGDGVYFERKKVNLMVPVLDEDGRPIPTKAWMYVGIPKVWRPEIAWNLEFYRGRDGSGMELAKTIKDNRQWLGDYVSFSRENLTRPDARCRLYFHKGLNDPKQVSPEPFTMSKLPIK